MAMSERCVEWGEVTRALQRPAPEAKDGEWWTRCRRVFDLRSQLDALDASRSR
jgi:L-rhamnose mutarotase